MVSLNLFLGQVEIKLVDIVERHLVPVSSKNYQLVVQHHCTMSVSRAWLLSNYQVWVVLKRCQELWLSLFSKLCQSVWIWLPTRITNHIKRILHSLRGGFEQNVSIFFLVIDFKVLEHFCFFLVKYFFPLFVDHFTGTSSFFVMVNSWESFGLGRVIMERGSWRLIVGTESNSDSLVPAFLFLLSFLCTFVSFVFLWTTFPLNFSGWILFESGPSLFN